MGKFRGGHGVVREIELLTDADATILSDRRKSRPYGMAGGLPGKAGRTTLLSDGRVRRLASKSHFHVRAGERIRVETPGGGGWGSPGRVRPGRTVHRG